MAYSTQNPKAHYIVKKGLINPDRPYPHYVYPGDWDRETLREILLTLACPIPCVGVRQPDGEDWHHWCENKVDDALAILGL